MTLPSTDVAAISAAPIIMKLTARKYIEATKKLSKSSGWKYQTQRFLLNRLTEISRLKKEVESGNYEPEQGSVFEINENGHHRLVKSMVARDAVFQHALCDGVIIPTVKRRIIHDNAAQGSKEEGYPTRAAASRSI